MQCSAISDLDAPYIISNISTPKHQTRYKFIRDMKEFGVGKFKEDFKLIPFSTVDTFNNLEDHSNILDKPILHCIEGHASFKIYKFTQPPAPR